MRLADFIASHSEAILAEWEGFAATLHPAALKMTPLALRDHAAQILEAVAADLSAPQTRAEQADKSKGWAQKRAGSPQTAAETHALLRGKSGFDINQLVAEYRALRASVLRLWMDACDPSGTDLDDVIRFNEAIDQAVAESLRFFSTQAEQARNLLLGVVGHDMRSPLNTIQITAAYLAALNAGKEVSAAAARLIRSGEAMKALLDDLVDFNRTQLGLGIRIVPADIDLAALVAEELEQLRGAGSRCPLELKVIGDSRGRWDGRRLQQVLRNLVTNAVKYGESGRPVRVTLTGTEAEVRLEVSNSGAPIDPSVLEHIFDPLNRGVLPRDDRDADSGLGIGLFVVREVTRAHGGQVNAHCDAGETVFSVTLPRTPGD